MSSLRSYRTPRTSKQKKDAVLTAATKINPLAAIACSLNVSSSNIQANNCHFSIIPFIPSSWWWRLSKRILAGGIAFFIIGVIFAGIESGVQSDSSSEKAVCESEIGRFGQLLSEEARARCAAISTANTFGVISQLGGYGLVVLGILLIAVVGYRVAKGSPNQKRQGDKLQQHGQLQTMFCRFCGRVRPAAGTNCSECGKPT